MKKWAWLGSYVSDVRKSICEGYLEFRADEEQLQLGSSPGFMDEIHSAWSLKDVSMETEDFCTKMVISETCAGQSMVHQNTS